MLDHDLPGVYNVAGDGLLPWSEVASIVGKRVLPLFPYGLSLVTGPLRRVGLELPPGVGLLGAHRHLEAVAVRVHEVDRLAHAVVLRPQHLHAVRLEALLALEQRLHVVDLERDVLHPPRRRVAAVVAAARHVEEGEIAAVAELKEDVDRVGFLADHLARRLSGLVERPRRLAVLGRHQAGDVFQADDLGVEIDRALRVTAAISDVVQASEHVAY